MRMQQEDADPLAKVDAEDDSAATKKVKLMICFHEFFQLRIYEFFLPNMYYEILVLLFSNAQNWEGKKIAFFDQYEISFLTFPACFYITVIFSTLTSKGQ